MVSLSIFAEEKYDWLINNNWWLETELFDINDPPRVIFRKLELISGGIMFQKLKYQKVKQSK